MDLFRIREEYISSLLSRIKIGLSKITVTQEEESKLTNSFAQQPNYILLREQNKPRV